MLRFNDGSAVTAQTVILATGLSYRRLAAPGLEALTGRGAFYGSARDRRSMDKPSSPRPCAGAPTVEAAGAHRPAVPKEQGPP